MAYNTKNILRSGDASPIPIPQFYNPTEDAFNPLTGANLGSGRYGADGVMWGKTAGGVYIPVQVNANGEVLTQLSGRNAELITLVNAQAITDTSQKLVSFDTKKYKSFDLLITNTLNQPVYIGFNGSGNLRLALPLKDGSIKRSSPWPTDNSCVCYSVPQTVLGVATLVNLKLSDLSMNLDTVVDQKFWMKYFMVLGLAYRCNVAPTEGALTITLMGVFN